MFLFITSLGASEPHASCIKLEPSTELIVAPKTRLQQQSSSASSSAPHQTHPTAGSSPPNNTSHLTTDLQSSTNNNPDSRLSSASSKESGFLSGFGGGDASTTMTDRSLPSFRESGFVTAATTPGVEPLDVDALPLGDDVPWSYRFWSTIKWLIFPHRGDSRFSNAMRKDTEEDARRKMAAEFWNDVRIICRVQPMLDKQKDDHTMRSVQSSYSMASIATRTPTPTSRPSSLPLNGVGGQGTKKTYHSSPSSNLSSSSSTNSYTHLMQPTTVYLSSSSDAYFHNQSSADEDPSSESSSNNDFVVFLAHLTKLLSPRERKDEMNKKLAEAQQKNQEGSAVNGNHHGKSSKDTLPKNTNAPLISCVVRCIIHTKELKGHKARQANNIYSSTTFEDTSIRWFIQIPELLRRQLGLECTSKVQLRPVVKPPLPIQSIKLHPLFEMVRCSSGYCTGFNLQYTYPKCDLQK